MYFSDCLLLCMLVVRTNQNIASCKLHWIVVHSEYQCRTLCSYIGICQDFSYNFKSRKCRIYSGTHGHSAIVAGTSENTSVNEKHKCNSNPCGPAEVCIPVWKGKDMRCLKQGCQCETPERHVRNASLVSELKDGMTARYQCDEGYAQVAGSDVIKCVGISWSRLSLTCKEVHCGEVNLTTPGLEPVTLDYSDTYMSTVVLDCALGYCMAGEGVSVCLQNATWSPPNITCTAITCGTPEGNISGSYLSNSNYVDVYNSTITYDCLDGDVKDGDGISVCQGDGTWSQPNISCSGNETFALQETQPEETNKTFVGNCKAPRHNITGAYVNTTDENNIYNSTITYLCAEGYRQKGDGLSVCQIDGTWSEPYIVCRENLTDTIQGCQCETPERHVRNASLVSELKDGMTARYQCDEGYAQVAGSDVIKCVGISWSRLSLTCKEVHCGEVNLTTPGLEPVTLDYSDTYMSTVVLDCALGYCMAGEGVSVCLQNATWSPPNITCTAITCGTPEGNISGSYLSNSNYVDVYNSTITYDCLDGDVKDGDGISVCQGDGTWSQPNISCSGNETFALQETQPEETNKTFVGNCKAPRHNITGAYVNTTDENNIYNSTITYLCAEGYRQKGDGLSVCQIDGTWSEPYIVCRENLTDTIQGNSNAGCEKPSFKIPHALSNLSSAVNATTSMLVYACDGNYTQVGDGVTRCLDGTWSPPNITCIHDGGPDVGGGNSNAGCEKPSFKIPHAFSNLSSAVNVTTSMLVYACDGNYTQVGDGVTRCLDGTWSLPNITCIHDGGRDIKGGVECDNNYPKVKLTKATVTSTQDGVKVTYVCLTGLTYYNGSNTSVCQSDGTWSQPTLMCGEYHLWASKVLNYSSQYTDKRWHASEILGPNDRYPDYGDLPNSWAGRYKICKKMDWIELKFTDALYIRRIEIYETFNAGMISKILVGSKGRSYRQIWKAKIFKLIKRSRIFSKKFNKTRKAYDHLKLYVNCIYAKDWVEIDAVKIIGLKITNKK